MTLQLVPTGAVYVCLVERDGKKLINEQIFNVGQTIPTETAREAPAHAGQRSVS